MADITVHAPAAPVAPSANADDSGHDSGAESTAMAASSSPTHGATKMVEGEILELTDFFKKTTVTEDDRRAYHNYGCNIPPGLIGLIAYLYHQVATSFPEAHLQRTLGLSVLGPEQFQDG
jgi:hypothetical protein